MADKKFFKVLREDMTSVGLLGAARKQYLFNVWNIPDEPISDHPRKGGGLWVVPTKSEAKKIRKYVLKKHGIQTRIFQCQIGGIIYSSSCRVKTDKLFFTEKDEIIN